MTDSENINDTITEFTDAWTDFEQRLGEFLRLLADPTLNSVCRLHAPQGDGDARKITLEGRILELAEGVDVRIWERRSTFYPLIEGADAMPDAAQEVCRVLRDDWHVAHPSLLAADGDAAMWNIAENLGLPRPAELPDESTEHERLRHLARLAARRDGPATSGLDEQGEPFPDAVFPISTEHLRGLVEATLDDKLRRYERDTDGDYLVETRMFGGVRIYVTVLEDRPLLRLWKVVASNVTSRRSAVIEANYLNRTYPLTKWTLRGHSLVQETFVPAIPFVAERFIEALEDFDDQYDDNKSQLLMRLGGEER